MEIKGLNHSSITDVAVTTIPRPNEL